MFGLARSFYNLPYEKVFDINELEDIEKIQMVLTDDNEKFKIKLELRKVYGLVSFDIINGFYSGLTITGRALNGYEEPRFEITSFEQDIDFKLFCEDITAELLE